MCSIKIEANGVHLQTGQLDESSLYDTLSIAVANYNVQHDNILHKHFPIKFSLLGAIGGGEGGLSLNLGLLIENTSSY